MERPNSYLLSLAYHLTKTETNNIIYIFIHSLACAECDDSVLFSGASSIPVCCVLLPSTLFHQLVFLPHFILPSISRSASQPCCFQIHNSFFGILFSSILCTYPNQRNLFSLIVCYSMFLNHRINFFIC